MHARLVILILSVALIAIGLLAIRQEQYEAMCEMTRLHQQINRSRQNLWNDQSLVAKQLDPSKIHNAIAQQKMMMQPLVSPQNSTEQIKTADALVVAP